MRATDRGGNRNDFSEGVGDTSKGFQIHATKQSVIEYKVNAPSKTMSMNAGVVLIERGKQVRNGSDYTVEGKKSLNEYRKMNDPRQQQVSDTMRHRTSEMQLRLYGDSNMD